MAQKLVKSSKPHPVPKYKSWCGQAQAEEQKQAYKLTISSRGAQASPAAAKPRLSRSFELAAVIPSGAGAFLRTWENPNTQLRQIQIHKSNQLQVVIPSGTNFINADWSKGNYIFLATMPSKPSWEQQCNEKMRILVKWQRLASGYPDQSQVCARVVSVFLLCLCCACWVFALCLYWSNLC